MLFRSIFAVENNDHVFEFCNTNYWPFYHSSNLITIESDSKTLTALTKNHSQHKTVLIKFMNNSHTHEAESYTLSCKPRADGDSFGWKLESHSTIVDFHLPNQKTVAITSLKERKTERNYYIFFFNAVIKGDTHNIRAFIKDGINLNLQSNSITFPKNKYYFSTRIRVNHYVFRQTVWGAPSRPIDQVQRDQTALHLAVIAGHKETVPLLINAGASINAQNEFGNTPLVEAIVSKNDPIALLLIRNGCDVDMKTRNNLLPLRHAIERKRYDVVDAIAKKSKCVNDNPPKFGSPLAQAACSGDCKMVLTLLDNGALAIQESEGLLPIHHASGLNFPEVVKTFIERIKSKQEFVRVECCDEGKQSLTALIKTHISEKHQEELMVLMRNKLIELSTPD